MMTSGQHIGSGPSDLSYMTSKGAIHQATRILSSTLIPRGITVSTINPGPVDTGYATGERWQDVLDRMPLGRWGQEEAPAVQVVVVVLEVLVVVVVQVALVLVVVLGVLEALEVKVVQVIQAVQGLQEVPVVLEALEVKVVQVIQAVLAVLVVLVLQVVQAVLVVQGHGVP